MTDPRFLAPSAALGPDGILRVPGTPEGDLVLVRVAGRAHALRDRCPHAAALLSEGFLEGGALVCPTHFAAFDVETGIPADAPPKCPAARTFPVREHEGALFLA